MAIRKCIRSHRFCPVSCNLIWNTAADVQTATKCFKGLCCEHQISKLCRGLGKILWKTVGWLKHWCLCGAATRWFDWQIILSVPNALLGWFGVLRSIDFWLKQIIIINRPRRRLSHLWPFLKPSSFRSHGSTRYWMKEKHGKCEGTWQTRDTDSTLQNQKQTC